MHPQITPNALDAFWMPLTANKAFKAHPRLLARAEGMYYFTPGGERILDGTAGLWCVNAGHGRAEITAAIRLRGASWISRRRLTSPTRSPSPPRASWR